MHAHALRTVPVLGIVLTALAVAFTAVACGGDSEETSTADVISAISIMDSAGLHEIDESIDNDKTIPGDAQSTAEKLQAIALLTEWPTKDLETQATNLAKILGEMASALDSENPDMAKVAQAVQKAHDAEHDFSHEVWKHLHEEAGMGHSDGGH